MKYLSFIILICCSCSCTKSTTPPESAVSSEETDPLSGGFYNQPMPPSLILPDTPPTARNIEVFKRIKPSMSMQDVVRICGVPDQDIGSGIYIFIYKLDDGTQVWIGTGDLNKLLYVNRAFPDGHSESVLKQ